MNISQHKEVYKRAIKKWGADAQLLMVFEEMSELQLAICKSTRLSNPQTDAQKKLAIIDEIADVYIMLGQLLEIYNIYEMEVEHKVIVKISRLESRLKEGEPK